MGFSRDANNVRHAFIRSKHGSFTIFDAPGAGTAPGQGTRAYSINPSGTITGFFSDSVGAAHGYVRSKHGVITVFDAPGAGTGPGQGTFVFSPEIINDEGEIAGHYVDSAGVGHGFLRDKHGFIATFDAPGAAQTLATVRLATESARMGRLQDITMTRAMRVTVSCAISMASSRPSMFQAPAPGRSKVHLEGVLLGSGTIMGNY